MPKSPSETTSCSDTNEHPGDLVISSAPGRKGTYLYIQRGSVMHAIARFMNESSVEEFRDLIKAIEAAGMKIKWIGDGEEGCSQEQA